MTDKPTDRELDDYLAGRSPLSARYREASRETTAPELDAAILSQARSPVRPPVVLAPVRAQPQKPARLPWQQRWAVPVGIAATLLIGVDLAWRVSDRVSDRVSLDERRRAASVRLDEAPVASAPAVAMAPSTMAEPQPAAAAPSVADTAKVAGEDSVRTSEVAREAVADASAAGEPIPDMQMQDSAPAVAVAESFAEPAPAPAAASEVDAQAEAELAQTERSGELARQSMQGQETEARRERAQAERRAYAFAPAPPAAAKAVPAPRRDADAAGFAAVDLARLLRDADGDGLRERYAASQLTRQALADAATVFADDLQPRLSQDAEGVWRVDYVDAGQRLRCTARLRPTAEGWQLEGLVTRPR